jgi:cytochrome c556
MALPAMLVALGLCLPAQTASKGAAPAKPATPAMQVQSNLNQLMRGVLYPASNVVFFAQSENPADVKYVPGQDPSMATDPLTSTFGGWQAVENAALALTESTNLLLIPGRTCANGVPVPMDNPDWPKFVQELREAGMKAYQAAQSKNQDKMVEAADTLSAACAGCHRKWREKPRPAERCK